MSTLINIDNGGTLTDVVVVNDGAVHRVKTLTTPSDLSRCFFDGLEKASEAVYGTRDVDRLIGECDVIRYSTTQGTNALVQRRGPQIGVLVSADFDADRLRELEGSAGLFDALVGDRVARIGDPAGNGEFRASVIEAIAALTAAGSRRIVVCLSGPDAAQTEATVKRLALEAFPSHLLGTVPLGISHETAADADDHRRAWTAILGAYLHPAMERFLFHTDHRLRRRRIAAPLLVFRNDGGAARVARTPALRSYSSGPRGGLEGVRALAVHHGLRDVVSLDVGGTTTDVGRVQDGVILERRHGAVEGVATSFPLPDLVSLGVGGGSILRVADAAITVGPDSVGAAPGPACFGLGGREATITDALLVDGLLDPETYFGGDLRLDTERASAVIGEHVAAPLGVGLPEAVARLRAAWVEAIARGIAADAPPEQDTVLVAFGGAGPLLVADVADALGVDRVLVPRAAAVFSAYGIGFSDVSHEYLAPLSDDAPETARAARDQLLEQAERDMFAERTALADCRVEVMLLVADEDRVQRIPLDAECRPPGDLPLERRGDTLAVRVAKPTRRPEPTPPDRAGVAPAATRTVAGRELPLHRVEDLGPGDEVAGPAVVEEELFTASLPVGWRLSVDPSGDLWLRRRT